MELLETLKDLGLSSKEAKIYMALLQMGRAGAASLAKEVNLPRQTVYSLLEDLVVSRFIEQSDKKGVRQYYADPNQLLRLLNQRKEQLDMHKRVVREELPRLLAKGRRAKALPVVQYYEGQEGLKRLFENILAQYQKGKLKSFRGFGINQFYPGIEEFMASFVKKRNEYGVRADLFIANAPDKFGIEGEHNSLGRTFKRLPIEPQQAAIYFVGDAIYLFSYEDNVGIMVENKAISRYLKDVFDSFWEKTP